MAQFFAIMAAILASPIFTAAVALAGEVGSNRGGL